MPQQLAAEAGRGHGGRRRRKRQEATRPEDSRRLGGGGTGVDGDQEVEVVIWEGKGAGTTLLEGDPPLWVQANAASGLVNRLPRGVNAADTAAGELAGEKEGAGAVAAFDLQDPLRVADVKDRGSKRG